MRVLESIAEEGPCREQRDVLEFELCMVGLQVILLLSLTLTSLPLLSFMLSVLVITAPMLLVLTVACSKSSTARATTAKYRELIVSVRTTVIPRAATSTATSLAWSCVTTAHNSLAFCTWS
jgi:uncharacterized membrane protein